MSDPTVPPPPVSPPPVSPSTPSLVSMRGAAGILSEAGLAWKAARAVLLCGLAGPGVRAGGTILYEVAEVEELLSRPWVQPIGIERALVGRLAAGRLTLGGTAVAQRDQVRHGWVADPITRLRLRLAVEEDGYFPFVATVSGYVVLGADVVGVAVRRPGTAGDPDPAAPTTSLELAAPGGWWERYAGHRLATGRGHHWTFWPEADPQRPLTTPTTEPPRARPTRRRAREQGMRVDPTALQQ